MQIKQKVFSERKINGSKMTQSQTNELKLVINGIRTDKPVSDLFVKMKAGESFIKGWSLLQYLENNKLSINEEKYSIALWNSANGEDNYTIDSIENPGWQMNDKALTETQVDDYCQIVQNLSTEPAKAEPVETEAEVETKSVEPQQEVSTEASSSEEEPAAEEETTEEEPATEEETNEEEPAAEEETVAEEEPAAEEETIEEQATEENTPINNEAYHKISTELKLKGYKEYRDENYVLLHKNGKAIGDIYLLKLNEGDFDSITLEISDETKGGILYHFYEGEEKTLLLFEPLKKKMKIVRS